MTDTDVAAAQAFTDKRKGVAASELSTSQSFLIDLCELLGLDRPHPTPEQDYMFERPLTFQHADGSTRTAPWSVNDIAARFTARGPWKKRLPQLLDMLVALGRAEPREGGVYGVGR